jgi:putative ABC transport system permease protein
VGGEEPERLFGAKVSDNFFTMLGVNPVAGRILRPVEQGPGKTSSLVIGYGFWQRRFGGDPGVIGRKVELDGEPFTIVAVMPARFRYRGTEFWFPFTFHLADPPRNQRWYQVLARGLNLATNFTNYTKKFVKIREIRGHAFLSTAES